MRFDLGNKNLFWGLVAASFACFFALSALFFLYLNTALTDYSSWDTAWLHQRLYDFLHGYWYQTSLYRLASPYAYAHDFANHLTNRLLGQVAALSRRGIQIRTDTIG